MQLYNASTGVGLINKTRYLTHTTSTEYSDNDVERNINNYYHLLVNEILDSMGGWDFQGEIATTDLEADKREYPFPSDLLKIKKIQLKLDGSDWVEAPFFDINETQADIGDESSIQDNFSNDSPYVDLHDQSMFIYSDEIDDVTGGVKIWYEDEITELSADSDEPLITEAYQVGLCYGAAKDYFQRVQKYNEADKMDEQLEKVIARMKVFYETKTPDRKYRLGMAWENYE